MIFKNRMLCLACVALGLSLCAATVFTDDQSLAREFRPPLAARISVPIKNKFNLGSGFEDAFVYDMEFQPVCPLALGEFNLINRFIVPVTHQEGLYPGMNDEFDLRNITGQAFTSPAKPKKNIWGLKPAVILPANSDDRRGKNKWTSGPAAIYLGVQDPWVNGLLGQHFRDFAERKRIR